MTLQEYAEHELDLLENEEYKQALMGVVDYFCEEGHSGGSASYGRNKILFDLKQILSYKPLTPVTDDEFTEESHGMIQHSRVFSLFKDKDGTLCDNDMVLFYDRGEPQSLYYNGALARKYLKKVGKPIEFPYFPKAEERVIVCAESLDEDEIEYQK